MYGYLRGKVLLALPEGRGRGSVEMYGYLRGWVVLSKQLLVQFDVLAVSVPTPGRSECFGASRDLALELQVLNRGYYIE